MRSYALPLSCPLAYAHGLHGAMKQAYQMLICGFVCTHEPHNSTVCGLTLIDSPLHLASTQETTKEAQIVLLL